MISIRTEKFIRFETVEGEQKCAVLAELNCDTAEDLPFADGIDGRILVQGSIAWDISTGDFYGLDSEGNWHNQNGEDAVLSSNLQQNLNVLSGTDLPLMNGAEAEDK